VAVGTLRTPPRVAASGHWRDDDGVRLPAGEVHAWEPGSNSTACGLALRRSQLERFPHVPFADALPESGGSADEVRAVCRRCAAAAGRRRDGRAWDRRNPRP
jgi:hypothetical protein